MMVNSPRQDTMQTTKEALAFSNYNVQFYEKLIEKHS